MKIYRGWPPLKDLSDRWYVLLLIYKFNVPMPKKLQESVEYYTKHFPFFSDEGFPYGGGGGAESAPGQGK